MVAGAMVVNVLSLLQLADELASAMAAANEAGEREVVPDAGAVWFQCACR